ncbi:E3 ubiquitin-protein ligase UBR2 [Ictalurus punctatus]|uniref:E3 ubiquitin-protein ligase n=1 Tax=Ictalurus punctatus TaxID=7998 RepID=A0A9F7RD83_ICTPU|nr:E3 ubiquitin-protein ligase UBR2 [Ictalurus punctatus]
MLGAVLQWAMEPTGGHWSESMLQRMVVSIKTMRECTAAAPPCEGTGHCHKETVWDKDKAERKRKAELCWKKTMAQTLESQSHFFNKYIDLLTQDSEDLDASASTSAEHSPSSCDGALVCVGPRRWSARGGERRQMEMCILCHEAQEILPDGTAMVLAAFVQRSTVMSCPRTAKDPLTIQRAMIPSSCTLTCPLVPIPAAVATSCTLTAGRGGGNVQFSTEEEEEEELGEKQGRRVLMVFTAHLESHRHLSTGG